MIKKLFFSLLFFQFSCFGHAQTFLNGSFENHPAVGDQINLSNPAFNALMANTFAFGSFGDMDIITSATWCAGAQHLLWYVALTGSGTDAFSMQLSTPLITGNSYTISFWDRGCWPISPPVQIGVSTVNNAFGTVVYTAPTPTQGTWVQRTFTFNAPNNGQYITVQLPTGGLGDWTHVDNFSFVNNGPPSPNFSASNTNICVGSCINFSDLSTGSPTSWQWTFTGGTPSTSTAQNPNNICYNAPGTYAVALTATNGNGSSTSTQTGYITVNPLPTVSAGNNTSVCIGSSTNLNATGATTYVWSPSTGLSNPNIANPVATPTATTTYTVTGTDANGCSNTSTVTITVNPLPTITAASNATICNGGSVNLSASGGISYVWSPSTGLSNPNISNPVATPSTTTTYTVTGTDANGCSNTATVTITVTGGPTVIASANVSVCLGSSTNLTASGAVTYVWSPSAGLNNPNIANPVATPTATTTYTVTGTDANGCIGTATVTVTVNPLPVANAGADQSICAPGTVQLNASGGVSYSWIPASGLSSNVVANPIASPTVTTSYTVVVTDANGCTNTDVVVVNVNPLPTATASGGQTICVGETANLSAGGGQTYSWLPSNTLSSSNTSTTIASPTTTTTYTVFVSNGNNCVDTATVTVIVNPLPNANAGPDQTISYGGNTTINGSGGTTYVWMPSSGLSCTNCPSPVASPNVTTTYYVVVTDANGCTDIDTVTIFVEYNCGPVFVPTAFSPNGNGTNDVFYVRGNCIVELTLIIFDRWGEKVFESNSPSTGWNGKFKDKDLDPAVFTYYYKGKLITGESISGKGNVSLIR